MCQLDFFSNEEFQALNENVKKVKDSSDSVRRGIFARLDAHKKEMQAKITEQSEEINQIKHLLNEMKNLINFAEERVG